MAQKAKGAGTTDNLVEAVQVVYNALEPLSIEDRDKVIASVQALLGSRSTAPSQTTTTAPTVGSLPQATTRPKSLVEVIQEKGPRTIIDNITLFAYYRDMYERLPRFARNDLKGYFSKARLGPPSNFDRDFVEAVKRGWLHEEGSGSYITTKGIEAVESGFPTERRTKETKARRPARGKPSARAGKKKASSKKTR